MAVTLLAALPTAALATSEPMSYADRLSAFLDAAPDVRGGEASMLVPPGHALFAELDVATWAFRVASVPIGEPIPRHGDVDANCVNAMPRSERGLRSGPDPAMAVPGQPESCSYQMHYAPISRVAILTAGDRRGSVGAYNWAWTNEGGLSIQCSPAGAGAWAAGVGDVPTGTCTWRASIDPASFGAWVGWALNAHSNGFTVGRITH